MKDCSVEILSIGPTIASLALVAIGASAATKIIPTTEIVRRDHEYGCKKKRGRFVRNDFSRLVSQYSTHGVKTRAVEINMRCKFYCNLR
jgi:hypothetical protein